MATIVLSAVGMAVGGSIGGSVLGLSTAVIGRAVGATIGRGIDQRLMGSASETVETGRIDRFRLTGASEGAPVQQVFGRMRIAGQVIWATRFFEDKESSTSSTGGGKATRRAPASSTTTVEYTYSLSLALALCEGEITRVGRIWADGVEINANDLTLRVYQGSQTQTPDPRMEAVEGAGAVPAYRGIAYVVIEDLDIGRFGNRVPQFTFEVFRPSLPQVSEDAADIARQVRGVCLVPGTGEYALATRAVTMKKKFGHEEAVNINSPGNKTDLKVSLDALKDELPECSSVSLVVSWFGTDLRAGDCQIKPRVEQKTTDGQEMPWVVSGLARSAAGTVPVLDGRSIYGGTPADASVVQAIAALASRNMNAVFYPFILMEQLSSNTLLDPWTGQAPQPALPWRGRITSSLAAGLSGSPDGTAAAEAEVASFFGTVTRSDFSISGTTVNYYGTNQWSYRRFILHYAYLCKAAGGVSAFCIGSEMRGLTQIRGAGGTFPAVAALKALAADVKIVLGAGCKVGYAADWSEYHGYQPPGTGDKVFHLDALWSDPAISFIGIDNYMPLSDWRSGDDHLDAGAGSIYDLDYLKSNIAGGEGFDWFYASTEARDAQIRTPIEDFYGEPWVWRNKDLKGWWQNPHHNRINGQRSETPTAWIPESKPIWFTEYGCAAIDRGTNEPNKFLDPKSSESQLPYGSNGTRDDLIQVQYLRAMIGHFADPDNNPVSATSGHQMVDMSRAHVWAWDARPFPFFPARRSLWADGANYGKGHWLNGRSTSRTLASVVAEICQRSGVSHYDVSRLHGIVRGYGVADVTSARSALQPLMLAFGFDAVDRNGKLTFFSRGQGAGQLVEKQEFVANPGDQADFELVRAPAAEMAGRVRINFVDSDGDYETRSAEAVLADEATFSVSTSEFPLVLTRSEGRLIAERWLAESRMSRETLQFSLPPSRSDLGAGDLVKFGAGLDADLYRIDRVEVSEARSIEAVRVDQSIYRTSDIEDEAATLRPFAAPSPVAALLLDLPLLSGDEVPHAPYIAATGVPWPGTVAVYKSKTGSNYSLNKRLTKPAVIGQTLTPMFRAAPGLWDRGAPLRVQLVRGGLSAVAPDDVLGGANFAAIGDGTPANWELFQFASADLVAPDTYDLSLRLRGQAGTDAISPDNWPVGSFFVLLDDIPQQLNISPSGVGIDQYLRYGSAALPLDDPSYREVTTTFAGIGNRPYAPCHLTATKSGNTHVFSWVRRTRIGGDSWSGLDVPVSEESEMYMVKIVQGGLQKRLMTLTVPSFAYDSSMRAADGVSGPYRIEIAQVSATFGPGPVTGTVVTL